VICGPGQLLLPAAALFLDRIGLIPVASAHLAAVFIAPLAGEARLARVFFP
jgi:hypothetical protein